MLIFVGEVIIIIPPSPQKKIIIIILYCCNSSSKKSSSVSVVVVIVMFLAVGGQFRPFETLRFAVTFQTVHISSLTSPCNPNFGPPQISLFCVCADHTTDNFFSIFHFLAVFGPLSSVFRSSRARRCDLFFQTLSKFE